MFQHVVCEEGTTRIWSFADQRFDSPSFKGHWLDRVLFSGMWRDRWSCILYDACQ